jgi:hypothetical protein
MHNIYKHAHFNPDPFGHGGQKRTAQIDEILRNAGIDYYQPDFANTAIFKNKLPLYLTGLNYNKNLRTSNKSRYAIGRYLKLFESFVEENNPRLFLWESTVGYNLLLAEVLYKKNVPVIALPHNIESLVAGSKSVFSNKISPGWLLEELKYLSYCDKTFVISREENWLLSSAGLNASYLPYYPPAESEKYLLAIRDRRQRQGKNRKQTKNILLLGTFYNKPTFEGYTDLLQHIYRHKDLLINVAGFGSEQMENMFPGERIKIWGSVSNMKLTELISDADYGIIHQPPTSGALTRVPELLLAGLPLLLNIHAARNCYDFDGIKVYNSYPELSDLLHTDHPSSPRLFTRPAEENIFVDFIRANIR